MSGSVEPSCTRGAFVDDTEKLATVCRTLGFEALTELIQRMEKGENPYDFKNPGGALRSLKWYVDYATGKTLIPPKIAPFPGGVKEAPNNPGPKGGAIGLPEIAPAPRPKPVPIDPVIIDPSKHTPPPDLIPPGKLPGPDAGIGTPLAPKPRPKIPSKAPTPDEFIILLLKDP